MTVEIPVEYQQLVTDAISRGEFNTETEMVAEGLRVLEERRRTAEYLRQEMQIGLNELDRGEYDEFDEKSLKEFFERVKTEGRIELERQQQSR